MTYKLLVGVYGDAVSTLEFDPAAKALKVLKESTVSPNPSWIAAGKDGLYGISEAEPGLVTRLQLEGDGVKETSKKETGGGPAHVLITSKEDVVVSNVSVFSVPSSIPPRVFLESSSRLPHAWAGPPAVPPTTSYMPETLSLSTSLLWICYGAGRRKADISTSVAACSGTTRSFLSHTLTRTGKRRIRSVRTRRTPIMRWSTMAVFSSVTSAATRCGS